MGVILKAINDELARRGHMAPLAKASGYFYFHLGEAAGWLDRTISVPRVSSLSLKEWLAEYDRLKKLNQDIMRMGQKRVRKVSR
jgi:hypothetical protein